VQYFKDDASASTTRKKGTITAGRAQQPHQRILMTKLKRDRVPTHFVRRLNMREQLVREVEIIPIKVVIATSPPGGFAKRSASAEGTVLPRSIVEYYYKSDELDDRWSRRAHHRLRLGDDAGSRRHDADGAEDLTIS